MQKYFDLKYLDMKTRIENNITYFNKFYDLKNYLCTESEVNKKVIPNKEFLAVTKLKS